MCACRLSPFLVIRHTFQDGWTSKGGKSSNRSNISLTESEWRPSTHNDFWTTGLCHFWSQWCFYCNSRSLVDQRCHSNDNYNAFSWIIFRGFILLVLAMDLWLFIPLFCHFILSTILFLDNAAWNYFVISFYIFFLDKFLHRIYSRKYPFCDWVNLACNSVKLYLIHASLTLAPVFNWTTISRKNRNNECVWHHFGMQSNRK